MKSADEMREQARKRLYKHREDMMAKGYKSTTVFIGMDILNEFDRLRDVHGWTRHESLDYFFSYYLDSLKVKGTVPESVIDEFDFDLDEPLSTTDINLGDWHNKTMDVETKDKILIQLAMDLPGTKNAQKRVEILNQAGITSGKVPFNKKKFTDNLRLAKQRQAKREATS